MSLDDKLKILFIFLFCVCVCFFFGGVWCGVNTSFLMGTFGMHKITLDHMNFSPGTRHGNGNKSFRFDYMIQVLLMQLM